MERRGLACGNARMDLRASFPVARWAGARAGDLNAPVRIRLRINSSFSLSQGLVFTCPPSNYTLDSVVICFLMDTDAEGPISFLISRMVHLDDPWVTLFLEREISTFAFQAAQASRQIGSHGFDIFADVDVLEDLGSIGADVVPSALLQDAEEMDGVLIVSQEMDGVLIVSPDEEEMDDVLILSPDEEVLIAGGGETRRHPASRSEIESLKTVRYSGDSRMSQEACAICCDDFETEMEVVMMPLCSHVFHAHCLLRWLEESRACPLCRTNIAAAGIEEE